MARLFDAQTMQPVEVPDADAPAHILSGRYGLEGGKEVLLQSPDGKMFAMPAESAPQAFQQGYTFASQGPLRSEELEEKYGAIGGKLLALGAGAARGFSFGLSDRALRNVGVEAETLRAAQEGAPFTSGVGQVAGVVLPMVLSGGSGAVAEGASAAGALPNAVAGIGSMAGKGVVSTLGLGGKSLLARAGAKAVELGVAGGVEGALYGAGNAVTEDALGRADLNAESLIANVKLGALVGFGSGAILGGGGVLVGAGAKAAAAAVKDKLSSGSIKEWLEDFAGESALRATFGRQKRAFKMTDEKDLTDKAGKYLLEDIGLGTDGALKAAGNTNEAIAERLAERAKVLDSKRASIVEALDNATAAEPLERVSQAKIAKAIRDEILPDIDKEAQRSVYSAVEQYADDLGANGGKVLSFKEAAKKRANAQVNAKLDSANPGPLRERWNQIARLWNEKIDAAAEPVMSRLGETQQKAYRAVREEFALVKHLQDFAESRVQGDLANRRVSPSSYGVGLVTGLADAGSGGAVSLVKGAAGAAAHQTILERGNAVMANVAHKLSRLQFIQKASDAVTKRIDSALERVISGKGPQGRAVAPAAIQLLINTPFLPEAKGAKKVANRKEAAKQRSRELSQLMADPNRVADRITAATSGLNEAAPNITTQAVITATKALQYLHAKAPKNPQSTSTLQPLLDNWEPSDQEVASFERRLKAAFDPLSVIDDLADGKMSAEGAETMRDLYPQLHRETLERLTERLSESKDKLPYETRINLSILLGVPVDDTMNPDFIRRSQEGWAQKPTEGQGGGGQRVTELGNLQLGDTMRSDTQKREATR